MRGLYKGVKQFCFGPARPKSLLLPIESSVIPLNKQEITEFMAQYRAYEQFHDKTAPWRDVAITVVLVIAGGSLAVYQNKDRLGGLMQTAAHIGLLHGFIASIHPVFFCGVAYMVLTRDQYFRFQKKEGTETDYLWNTGDNKYIRKLTASLQ
jgi:hypothetical protein